MCRAFIIYIVSLLLNEIVSRLFFFTLRFKSTIINKNDERGKTYMVVKRTRESEEMYLETILLLRRENPHVRAVDVCDALGYAKSSVSRGVNLLKNKGYIEVEIIYEDKKIVERRIYIETRRVSAKVGLPIHENMDTLSVETRRPYP